MKKPTWTDRSECRKLARIVRAQHPIVVYDLETTGLDKEKDRAVQICAVKLNNRAGRYQITDTLNTYVNPGIPIPQEASAVNHITNEMLQKAPTEAELAPKLEKFFGETSQTAYAGYNSSNFDCFFVHDLCKRVLGKDTFPVKDKDGMTSDNMVDVLVMAKELLDRTDIKDALSAKVENEAELKAHTMQLGFVSRFLGVQPKGDLHNALTDTMVTGGVMWNLLQRHLSDEQAQLTDYRMPSIVLDRFWYSEYRWNQKYIMMRVHINLKDNNSSLKYKIHYDIYNHRYVDDGIIIDDSRTDVRKNTSVFEIGNIAAFNRMLKARYGDSLDGMKKGD